MTKKPRNKNVSCDCLATIFEQYPMPFFRPIQIDPETKDMVAMGWHVRLFRYVSGGKLRDTAMMKLNFCPNCGSPLVSGEKARGENVEAALDAANADAPV
jgi:hypothetical protein